MPTILAGQVVPVFFSSDGSISITPGSAGRVSLNARAQDGSQGVVPREIYSAQTIDVQAGTTVVVEAINTDASYTVSSSSGGVVDATSVQAALSSDQAGGRTALGLGTAATQPATAFVQVSDVADLAALLALSSPTGGQRARTIAPVLGSTSNGGISYLRWVYDGTTWRLDGPQALLIDYSADTGTTGTSVQFLKQRTAAVGLFALLRGWSAKVHFAKSGATDTATYALRLGTAGNATDASLVNATTMTAANRNVPIEHRRAYSSATVLNLDSVSATSGYIGTASNAAPYPSQVTVPNMTSSALILSAIMTMGASTDTPTVASMVVEGW